MKLDVKSVAIQIDSQRIVEEISLQVAPGEIVGLIGPNGSGKSTLLRAVYRLLKPVAGYVHLGNDDVWAISARESARRTGVVVQETPSDFDFTVREVVEMGRTPHKGMLEADNDRDVQIVSNALARVRMSTLVDRSFNTLSGGEKQRVLVARALAQEPKLLVLDEPTNHLDIRYQLDILNLVRELGITTLLTLHDLNLAAAYCQRLYLLAAGRIATTGKPADVLTSHWVRSIYGVDVHCGVHPITGQLHLAFMAMNETQQEARAA